MFAKLLLAHLIADFMLQNKWLIRRKLHWDGQCIHVGLVFLMMVGVAWNELEQWWPWLIYLAVIHAATDWAKLYMERRIKLPPILPFLGDQAVHISAALSAVLLCCAITGQPLQFSFLFFKDELSWWIADLYLICTFAASIAFPTWMAPGSLMQRPGQARWATILAAGVLLTLSWQGLNLLILPVAACFYSIAVLWQNQKPALSTLHWEVLSASVLAVVAGWILL